MIETMTKSDHQYDQIFVSHGRCEEPGRRWKAPMAVDPRTGAVFTSSIPPGETDGSKSKVYVLVGNATFHSIIGNETTFSSDVDINDLSECIGPSPHKYVLVCNCR